MITESDMDCLKIDYLSDTKLPAVNDHASTLLSNHASTRLSTGLGSGASTLLSNHWIIGGSGRIIQHLHYLPVKKLRFFSSLTLENNRVYDRSDRWATAQPDESIPKTSPYRTTYVSPTPYQRPLIF